MDRWRQDERIQRWGGPVAIAYFVLFGPDAIGPLTSEPSIRDWVRLLPWVVATIGVTYATYGAWRRHRNPEQSVPAVRPSDVDDNDVIEAIEAIDVTTKRIDAIAKLRTRHPGLGLRDAKELVDRHLAD